MTQTSLGPGPDRARESYGIPLMDLREAIRQELAGTTQAMQRTAVRPPTTAAIPRNEVYFACKGGMSIAVNSRTNTIGAFERAPALRKGWHVICTLPLVNPDGYRSNFMYVIVKVDHIGQLFMLPPVRYMGDGCYEIG